MILPVLASALTSRSGFSTVTATFGAGAALAALLGGSSRPIETADANKNRRIRISPGPWTTSSPGCPVHALALSKAAHHSNRMTARSLFVTRLYESKIADAELRIDLAQSIRALARDDEAGRRWSEEHRYAGYTSYGSLNDLPKRDPAFNELAKRLTAHARKFADECAFETAYRPKLDSLWVNLLKLNGQHSGHIHPHSIISGTFYVEVPQGSGAIRFEDPRLPLMMAAPQRRKETIEELLPFVSIEPCSGLLLMWESWLRHEVLPGTGRGERLSISFNFA